MPTAQFDTLIIGQGLAGSALAWHLVERGERVCVLDDKHRSSSSKVAAGLINPLAGMRFNLRPGVRDCLASAEDWYRQLGTRFGRRLLHPLPMLRLFRSTEQQRFYERRVAAADSDDLIGASFATGTCPETVSAPHGGFIQQRTAYVDIPLLLSTLADWLDGRGALRNLAVDPAAIHIADDQVCVADINAHRLVFCDGARVRDNPWFDWLPLAPDKGEILDLNDRGWRPRHIINGAHWLLPLHGGGLRFGATHEHSQLGLHITSDARDTLLGGFRALRGERATITDVVAQRAGIRPSTADRQPFIGRHPTQPMLWVFNGFGARGALSIPWYAERLTRHLHDGDALPADADIRRL